jgi:hypothetical protein
VVPLVPDRVRCGCVPLSRLHFGVIGQWAVGHGMVHLLPVVLWLMVVGLFFGVGCQLSHSWWIAPVCAVVVLVVCLFCLWWFLVMGHSSSAGEKKREGKRKERRKGEGERRKEKEKEGGNKYTFFYEKSQY